MKRNIIITVVILSIFAYIANADENKHREPIMPELNPALNWENVGNQVDLPNAAPTSNNGLGDERRVGGADHQGNHTGWEKNGKATPEEAAANDYPQPTSGMIQTVTYEKVIVLPGGTFSVGDPLNPIIVQNTPLIITQQITLTPPPSSVSRIVSTPDDTVDDIGSTILEEKSHKDKSFK